ncbi:T3SS (YopN, CesT) and YbjN peptide-binding chaperone 1 [Rhodococcus gordoniae]|uniref:T3SS (YopN, CesT) and YbjN peptide-binding chaperone 1 n=1 Tax=Rhodococcus gordoniae TaxID=223392 RepID=UPI0035262B79
MTDTDRFDETLDRDWTRYASQLARRISELTGSDAFELRAETASGAAACVRVRAGSGGRATVEVTGSEPVTRPVSEADMLARHIVSVLRGRGEVPHPAFLQAHPPSALGDLRERVSDALAHALGRPVPVDADGDFVVILDSQVVFVMVDDDGNIRLWAPLLHAIPEDDIPGAAPDGGRTHALTELTELNRTWSHIKVVLVEDRLVATVDLLGDPFVPRHLSELLERLKGFLTVVDERFARRFDGVRYGSDREREIDLPTEDTVLDEPN